MLGRRRAVQEPANDALEVVPVFTPDPHGASMFAHITNGNAGYTRGPRAVIDARGDAWGGWAASPQPVMRDGIGHLGSARPTVPLVSTIDQERGLAPDNIQSIFAQRMAERRFG